MIEVSDLKKNYGNGYAVNGVSFSVKRGEILGFLGPNGAGKSTTMNIITGYLSPTEGTVKIDGIDILDKPTLAKSKIGYLPEIPPLYADMTVEEYISFIYDLKKVKLPKEEHISEVCALVKISDVQTRMIRNLSKGYRQRVGIAQALLGNPEVLILDEPTVGLDPKQIIDIRNLIKGLGEKHTVILSSHILTEIQSICERVIVINRGQIIADDTPDNLASELSSDHRLVIRIACNDENAIKQILLKVDDIVDILPIGAREDKTAFEFKIESKPNVDVRREIFRVLAEADMPILALKTAELSLEDIFLQLTGSGS